MLFITATQEKRGSLDIKPFLSVKSIFSDNWDSYLQSHELREIEKSEVEKMLSCKGESRGCFVYYCNACNQYEIVPFGCNSRLCSCCGKRHTDSWAERLSKRLLKQISHKHLTFSIPDVLWGFIKRDRSLQKAIMDAAYLATKEMFSLTAKKEITPGFITILHPFGRDIVFKPHVHALVTNGGFDKQNMFIHLGNYINYNTFHKKWQYHILTSLRGEIPDKVIDYCFRKYPNGFVAYIKPEKIYANKYLIRYIGRYLRHPAIANSRIIAYNKEAVRFYYENHGGIKHYEIMLVDDFISAVIQHIPEKNQRLVRYYGAYSRRISKKFRKDDKQLTIFPLISKKRVAYCPNCGEEMELILYLKKPPPKDMSKITSWISLF